MSYVRVLPKSPWVETQENPNIDFSLVCARTSTLLVEPVPTVCPTLSGTKYSKRSDFVGRVTLRVAIGGGIVPYKVYWNIGPSRPFASIAIGMRSLLLRSKSPIKALPDTGCWVVSSRSPEERCLHWQLKLWYRLLSWRGFDWKGVVLWRWQLWYRSQLYYIRANDD